VSDTDIRQAITLLVKACKAYQSKALCQNSALAAIMNLSPEDRARLTPARIEEAIASEKASVEQIVDLQAAALEQVLSSETDFLRHLKTYASSLLVMKNQ
jgi:hypothetical protein